MVELVAARLPDQGAPALRELPHSVRREMQTPQCVWQSQIQAAQWAGEHPDWVVKQVELRDARGVMARQWARA